jgi:hypothetical protein
MKPGIRSLLLSLDLPLTWSGNEVLKTRGSTTFTKIEISRKLWHNFKSVHSGEWIICTSFLFYPRTELKAFIPFKIIIAFPLILWFAIVSKLFGSSIAKAESVNLITQILACLSDRYCKLWSNGMLQDQNRAPKVSWALGQMFEPAKVMLDKGKETDNTTLKNCHLQN